MFAKQTVMSASLVALCGGAALARAEDDPSAQSEGEVHPPSSVEPSAPVEPRPPTGRFVLGAGYSTDEGFIAGATIAQDDLFHTGNQLSMHARLSERRQLFVLHAADPDVLGSQFGVSADLYNDTHQLPGFTRKAAGGTLTLSHPLGPHVSAFVGYRLEQVEVSREALYAART